VITGFFGNNVNLLYPSNNKIKYSQTLDTLLTISSYSQIEKLDLKADETISFVESFDFGGPRIYRHYWELHFTNFHSKLELYWSTKRKRILFPSKRKVEFFSLTMNQGQAYLNGHIVTLGKTTLEECSSLFRETALERIKPHEIHFHAKENDVKLIFNEKNILIRLIIFRSTDSNS